MKKVLTFITGLFLALFALVACSGNEGVKAEDLLNLIIIEEEGTTVTESFNVVGEITKGEKVYEITWASNKENLVVAEAANEDKSYTISVVRPETEQVEVTLTATISGKTRDFKFNVAPYDVYDFSSEFKFAYDKGNVAGEIELPLEYTLKGTDKKCTISWATKEGSLIKVEGGKATAPYTYTKLADSIQATFTYNNETTTKNYNVTIYDQVVYNHVTEIKEGQAYKMGFLQVNLENQYYFITGKQDGKYGGTTTDLAKAADVKFEAVGDKFKAFVEIDGNKTYINADLSTAAKCYVSLDGSITTPTEWAWNSEYNTLTVTAEDGTTFYMGTYSSYATLSSSVMSYAATSFVSHFYIQNEMAGDAHEYTAAEKLECEALSYVLEGTKYPGEYDLPATGKKFSDVVITYEVLEGDCASIKDGALIITPVTEAKDVKIKATFILGEATASNVYTITAEYILEPEVQEATLADILKVEASDEMKYVYKVTGTVSAWGSKPDAPAEAADQYGNFILKSGEDTIIVYGSTASKDAIKWEGAKFAFKNPKDFTSNAQTKAIKLNDTVELLVVRTSYKGTPQLNAVITKINDTEVVEVPKTTEINATVTEALAAASKLAAGEKTADTYIISGTVKEITDPWTENFGNITFYLTDGTNDLLCFRLKGDDASKVKVGDEVKVTVKLTNYVKEGADPVLEAVDGTVAITKAAEGETPEQPEIPAGPITNIADALTAADGAELVLTGTVKSIDSPWDTKYNNMCITLTDGTNDIYVYRVGTLVGLNDNITVTGTKTTYSQKPQVAQGCTAVINSVGEVEWTVDMTLVQYNLKDNATMPEAYDAYAYLWNADGNSGFISIANGKFTALNNYTGGLVLLMPVGTAAGWDNRLAQTVDYTVDAYEIVGPNGAPAEEGVYVVTLASDKSGNYIKDGDTADYATTLGLNELFSVKFNTNSCTNTNGIARLNSNGQLQIYGASDKNGAGFTLSINQPEGKTVTITGIRITATGSDGKIVNIDGAEAGSIASGELSIALNTTTGFTLTNANTAQIKFLSIEIIYTEA